MNRIYYRWKYRQYTVQRVIFILAILSLFAVVGYLAVNVNHNNTMTAKERFDNATEEKLSQLSYRVETYTDMLYSESALLAVKPSVTAQEWQTFTAGQKIRERYPGVYGLGYVHMDSPEHAILKALSTTDAAYNKVIGYDMYSNPPRKLALEKARDTGLAQATPPLSLMTDKPNDPPSLIIVLPVYDSSLRANSMEARRAAHTGFVVVGLHSKPLIDSIFASKTTFTNISCVIKVGGKLLYKHGSTPTDGHLEKTVSVDMAGQPWTITFTAPKTFGLSRTGTLGPELVVVLGFAFAIALLLIFWYSIRLKDLKHKRTETTPLK